MDGTAIETMVTAVAVAVTAVFTYLNNRKASKIQKVAEQTQADVSSVHTLVNSQHVSNQALVAQLTGALTDANVPVPARPPDPAVTP
jgi:hypothetical protein